MSTNHKAFSYVRSNIMPAALLYGRFNRTFYLKRHCSCEQGSPENPHAYAFALSAPPGLQHKVCLNFIKAGGESDMDKVRFMLSVEVADITERVADSMLIC